MKAKAGCDFVTSQISYDPKVALEFLKGYGALCRKTGAAPATVFVSLTTVPTPSILRLLEGLGVEVPPPVKRRLRAAPSMGGASLEVAAEFFQALMDGVERWRVGVPLGLQVEQIGVNSGALSLELLDRVYPSFS